MKKRTEQAAPPAVKTQLRSTGSGPGLLAQLPLGTAELRLYQALREALPVVDAAILKLVRLTGGFSVRTADPAAERALARFLRTVPCGRGQEGMDSFLSAYLDSLLTYGRAIGEMVVSGGHLQAVCWGDIARIQVRQGASPLDITLCASDENGVMRPLPRQELLLFTTLNPEPANPYGVSLLRSMPFLADVLLKIYRTLGVNWERAGNVRYSVVYRPDGSELDRSLAGQRAQQMAEQWAQAMEQTRTGAVRDFVAVGDVQIQTIGADAPILDSETPVRQLLEQLVAKTGLPPFLLGLSWSSTERMSSQQADMLTSELWAYRRTVEPVLRRVCRTWLRLEGWDCEPEIVWDDISLQDLVEEAQAGFYDARRDQIRAALNEKPKEDEQHDDL